MLLCKTKNKAKVKSKNEKY